MMLANLCRVGNVPKFPYHARVRTIKTVSKEFIHGKQISLNLIVPPSKEPKIIVCQNTNDLIQFVKTYNGTLCVTAADGSSEIISPGKYCQLCPSAVYEIVSPFFNPVSDERLHRQVADKAFEQKCHQALARYLNKRGVPFHQLDRNIQVDGKIVAEWQGVFQLASGQVWFLECKHCVTSVFYPINGYSTVI
jgi:hypothetical protein